MAIYKINSFIQINIIIGLSKGYINKYLKKDNRNKNNIFL